MIYVGIDPGVSGGIAALTSGGFVLDVWKMPETGRDVLDVMREIASHVGVEGPARAVMERVNPGVFGHSRDGEEKTGQRMGVKSAFTFGRGVERLQMALLAAEIPFDEVSPLTWQTTIGCRSRGNKNVTKARAQQLFPSQKITHAIADALLMAEYCRRLHGDKARPLPSPLPSEAFIEGRDSETHGKAQGGESRKEKGSKEDRARRTAGARQRARGPREVSGF